MCFLVEAAPESDSIPSKNGTFVLWVLLHRGKLLTGASHTLRSLTEILILVSKRKTLLTTTYLGKLLKEIG